MDEKEEKVLNENQEGEQKEFELPEELPILRRREPFSLFLSGDYRSVRALEGAGPSRSKTSS